MLYILKILDLLALLKIWITKIPLILFLFILSSNVSSENKLSSKNCESSSLDPKIFSSCDLSLKKESRWYEIINLTRPFTVKWATFKNKVNIYSLQGKHNSDKTFHSVQLRTCYYNFSGERTCQLSRDIPVLRHSNFFYSNDSISFLFPERKETPRKKNRCLKCRQGYPALDCYIVEIGSITYLNKFK